MKAVIVIGKKTKKIVDVVVMMKIATGTETETGMASVIENVILTAMTENVAIAGASEVTSPKTPLSINRLKSVINESAKISVAYLPRLRETMLEDHGQGNQTVDLAEVRVILVMSLLTR